MRHSLRGIGFALLLASGLQGVSEAQPPDRVDVLIGFRGHPQPADEAVVRGAGGEIRHVYRIVPAIAASVPVSALQGLSRSARVSVIEADGLVQAIDAELDAAWGIPHIHSGQAHAAGQTGAGVRVAIIDTGIDHTHDEFAENYVGGWDFVNEDDNPLDDHGHGTHVAGTVGAADDDTGVVGVAPGVMLYGFKVLSSTGSGSWSDIIAAVDATIEYGIHVTNNSYGASGYPGSIVQAAFDNSYAAGVLHVAANGNSGNCAGTGNSVGYPASFASVVGVAAVNESDDRACFSSTGPSSELAAPGVSIYSTRRGGGYTTMSGTSMASPHAAGVAALVFGAGITDAATVRQRLIDTALDLGSPGHDDWFGWGLVDAFAASDIGAPVNQPPTVTIMTPSNGSDFDSGTSVTLSASASDPEDGPIVDVAWSSSVDGPLGTGASLSTVLSDGTHALSASVTDGGGRSASDSVQVTVTPASPPPEPPGPEPEAKVASLSYSGRGGKSQDKHVDIIITVTDGSAPIAGAALVVNVIETGSNATMSTSGVTDGAGNLVIGLRNLDAGCYTTKVMDLQAAGYQWDGLTPGNGYCK